MWSARSPLTWCGFRSGAKHWVRQNDSAGRWEAGAPTNSGPTSIAWGGQDMRDIYIGSIATPYVLKGRSSVAGMPMVHQR